MRSKLSGLSYLWGMKHIYTTVYESPVGCLLLGDVDDGLCMCDWLDSPRLHANLRRIQRYAGIVDAVEALTPVHRHAVRMLDEYFAGTGHSFDISLRIYGTDLQQRVWRELRNIAYGATMSYSDVAASVGMRGLGVRSVAGAVASNPLSVFIPCHRVVGKDGGLVGYAGGIAAKQWMLALEHRD